LSGILQDIWVVKEDSGIVIFHKEGNKNVNPQLFGGLMSVLNSFAENLDEGGLSSFEFSDKKFSIIKNKGILFIGNCEKHDNAKKLNLILNKVMEKFFIRFSKELSKVWDGDIEIFSDFQNDLNEILLDPVEDFWKCLA
jgi:hypothetical protein